MDLENKVAVITGGASGLGRAAAQALSDAGAVVVIFDMNAEAGAQAVRELSPDRTRFIQLDVASGADAEAAFTAVLDDLGQVDICVNCAGIAVGGQKPLTARESPMTWISIARWSRST